VHRRSALTNRTLAIAAVALGAAAVSAMAPREAHAFCRTTTCSQKTDDCRPDERGCSTVGVPLRWQTTPLVFRFSARGSSLLVREEARAAVRAAFHRWSDATCSDGRRTSLRFVEGEDLPDDKPLVAGARGSAPFGIYFRDLGWPHATPDETLAQTNHVFGKATGVIEYSDVEINTGARRFALSESAEGIDLQAVLTHEVGHYIGLGHSKEVDSIMAAGYCEIDAQRCDKGKVAARRLAADDIAAVCALFPPDGPSAAAEAAAESEDDGAGGCAVSRSGRAAPAGTSTGTGALALALALTGVAVARFARIRRARTSR